MKELKMKLLLVCALALVIGAAPVKNIMWKKI
jgi:hypothetical protein